jgi:hypothetical protein
MPNCRRETVEASFPGAKRGETAADSNMIQKKSGGFASSSLADPQVRQAARAVRKAKYPPTRGSAETEAQIEEYWKLGCKVLNLPGTDTSTYLEGLKARAGRAHARLKSIGVPTP